MTRLDDAYFQRVYAADPDPWGFDTRWYEARKRSLTLASLPEQRYRSAFEPGCALGHLTVELAARCDELLAMDLHETMVQRARERLAGTSATEATTLVQGAIPEAWPVDRSFDLVVLSEVAYYLDADGLDELEQHLRSTLEPGGDLVAVHWTGETDYPSTADQTHARLDQIDVLEHRSALRDPHFRLDVWRRR